jgi:hypothetical protein
MNLSGNVNGLNKSVVTISSLAMQLEMVNVNQKLTDLGLPTMIFLVNNLFNQRKHRVLLRFMKW